ncbi:hypothetical protein [Paenibacillus mendelii]|uniref:Uncharacterized protein n=1 Tax=Paenibacillus mendelii TaxID=206163 RepID=A0ABV6J7B5_9BACL|nr:hypothetical protein [Paenibacillus mendelii]MCQ6562127.1 hypothetical protein [Paenibacillus mendelii]
MKIEQMQSSVSIDQLTGTDSLGRKLPQYGEVSEPRADRYVGIFYFLWLGQHGTKGPFDNTKIIAEAPEAVHDANHPLWGPKNAFHFWGEPLYGYYLNDDAWVLRKHVQLLTNAGIDFLVFDTTNAATYKKIYDKLFEIMDEVRIQGYKVPQIVFYTNSSSGETIEKVYTDLYKPGRHAELWFHWKGKPLIIGDPEECSDEINDFFTIRLNQWPFHDVKTNGFPWIEFFRPQRVYYNDEGEKEIINVAVAQHPTCSMSDTPFYNHEVNWGRSFHDGVNDDSPGAEYVGYNIEEQWEFARKEDPSIVFITGWNEWIAMRLEGPPERPILFVDQATLNFSRDIEPMKGGYNDNYYLQMIGHIRQFKGMARPQSAGGQHTIAIGNDFSAWAAVTPAYHDFIGDTAARNHPGYGDLVYQNDTGRNDLDTMKVAHDEDNIYFYARTSSIITPHTDKHWMMLLINVNGSRGTGWEGYDYIVNRKVIDASTTTVEHSLEGWNWSERGTVQYAVRENELQLSIPRVMLGLTNTDNPLQFEFKWVDHIQNEDDIMDFYQYGDAAPDGRLNYLYSGE